MNCVACGRQMVSQPVWRTLVPEVREQQRAAGIRSHAARGMCTTCYCGSRERGELIDHGRRTVPRSLVVDEWTHADMPREWSKAKRIRHLAPRLGMTEGALEKALLRAGVAA